MSFREGHPSQHTQGCHTKADPSDRGRLPPRWLLVTSYTPLLGPPYHTLCLPPRLTKTPSSPSYHKSSTDTNTASPGKEDEPPLQLPSGAHGMGSGVRAGQRAVKE